MCKVLNVSCSSYYYWSAQRPTKRTKENEAILIMITDSFTVSEKRYGSPKITQDLRAQGVNVSRPRVARLMKKANLKSVIQKKYVVTTTDSKHSYPVAENHLNRQFNPKKQGQAWVSDLTYIATGEGWLYLTIIMDLFDRKVIGWSLSTSMKASETTIPVWQMALKNRPIDRNLIFHRSGDPVGSRGTVCLSCIYQVVEKALTGFAKYERERQLLGQCRGGKLFQKLKVRNDLPIRL